MLSEDGGKNWNEAKNLASSSQKVDYPFLLQNKNAPYLAWNTQADGLQIVTLTK